MRNSANNVLSRITSSVRESFVPWKFAYNFHTCMLKRKWHWSGFPTFVFVHPLRQRCFIGILKITLKKWVVSEWHSDKCALIFYESCNFSFQYPYFFFCPYNIQLKFLGQLTMWSFDAQPKIMFLLALLNAMDYRFLILPHPVFLGWKQGNHKNYDHDDLLSHNS